jgi:starch synthase
MLKNKLKVLFAAAECAPFAKAGGLGDVIGSLPREILKLDCDVRIVIPLYGSIDRKKFKIKQLPINFKVCSNNSMLGVKVWESRLPGTRVPVYFIDSPRFFSSKNIYDGKQNNSERFLFFSLAALEALPALRFKPDIIHCHDYHTALIPDLVKMRKEQEFYRNIKTIYTIHNLNYQGISPIETLSTGNLSAKSLATLHRDAQNGDINFMVQGILNADAISTVSKKYAEEITTSTFGAEIDNIIRSRKEDLCGILNGIDDKLFNPATDKLIPFRYAAKTLRLKLKNKLALQKELGLEANAKIPLIGFVGRLAWQKGIELIASVKLSELACQFAVLGSGDEKYKKMMKGAAKKCKQSMRFRADFNLKLAQLIYAGADMLVMPSRFEPCGLSQMIAMRYGTVPIVRSTGGLADTVTNKTGFLFKEFSAGAFENSLKKAIHIYSADPARWRAMQLRGMEKDWSWKKPAGEYMKLYKKVIR